ncbi:CHAT domain-containing protein [Crossiella sp. CA-258035]|uniref:CHAT domain-containing protein n=1 Tax=Crossiella sp. CA-258035 TaxID=2981138 RepID=UPI0024BC8E54|nr:CHAT domain-containing protein [Crossiella sp. CA-258035]WHT17555.1 CHAT domain-containing protein [Crossiella sp. CA-258035]
MTTDELSTVLGHTDLAIAAIDEPDRAAWVFARCWARVVRFQHLEGDEQDLDRAFADVQSLPPDFPGRAKLAAAAVAAALQRGRLRTRERLLAARELTAIADADPVPLSAWPKTSAAVRAMALVSAAQHGEPGFHFDGAVAEAERLASAASGEEPYSTIADMALTTLRQQRSMANRDAGGAKGAAEELRDKRFAVGGADVMGVMAEFQASLLRLDTRRMVELWPQLAALADHPALPASTRAGLAEMLRSVAPFFTMLREGHDADPGGLGMMADPELIKVLVDSPLLADQPGLSTPEWALRAFTAATGQLALGTPEAIDRAITMLSEILERVDPHDARMGLYLTSLGAAIIDRHVRSGDREDLRRGIAVLERARDVVGSVTSAYWHMVAVPLAAAYRMSGRADLGHDTALSGLRAHCWNALVQADPVAVHAAARAAAGDALDAAHACLADHDPDRAVTALESGRGLILFSALERRDIERRLADAGKPALAQHWKRAVAFNPAEIPEDLRRQVMSELTGVPLVPGSQPGRPVGGPARLIDPPALPEVRAALGALGADALVYLLPGEQGTGAAVVVPAEDEASRYFLPDLTAAPLARFEDFLARSLRVAERDADADFESATTGDLTELCEWAWDVAIGPLLEHLPDDTKRIVLVPIGELARIPWHAALDRRTGEHAVERVAFSYTPSARLMCETAWRKRVAPGGHALVVADPDTKGTQRELVAARAEGLAVAALYPRARLVGRAPDGSAASGGRGTRADVAGWLGTAELGSTLHLACHGVVSYDADSSSYLLLADGDRLAAEELTAALTTSPGRDVALAVLAACRSGESGRGHDEAFSIGSAVLAANVRTVVSAQWNVPDAATSVLMFMFHHYLRAEGMPAADALRAAQLWALRDRTPPASMPWALRNHLTRHDVGAVEAWAGFTHAGQ